MIGRHFECTSTNTLKNWQCALQMHVPETTKTETLQEKNHITKCIMKINYIACAHGPESFAKGREIYFDTKIELLLLPIFHIISNATFSFYVIISSKKKKSLEVENYFQ